MYFKESQSKYGELLNWRAVHLLGPTIRATAQKDNLTPVSPFGNTVASPRVGSPDQDCIIPTKRHPLDTSHGRCRSRTRRRAS